MRESTVSSPLNVTVWGENLHEFHDAEHMAALYPDGMHATIAEAISSLLGERVNVRTATLDQPEHGLSDEVLASTDVLTWWGHMGHDKVDDAVVRKVHDRVLAGMGLIVLHSAHFSKIFKALMGTTCSLQWRDSNDTELVWTVKPDHPIADGVPHPIRIEGQEMYGELFDIPEPDELVFISSFTGGEVFRSGCTWRRGKGKVFYFSPGDQGYPVYHHPDVQRVIANGVLWAAPSPRATFERPDVVSQPAPRFSADDFARVAPGMQAGQEGHR
ncbi:ThuA domain-containing protein [Ruania alkalisoli]|uniref:ThuA domain-containing protein n=1 Tax=Ruania alkalisoli TaxID=2779775 RepID=A0A7M1SVP5_9MICO|nr:ThuA domain-containing protein [Ruania alkalisoli]QOR71618.1 ThuA domain-containing protein [Ruania alkalisoli]